MKRRVTSRIFVLFAVLMLVMTPALSFAADSTFLNNNAVLNKNLQKGSGGGVPVGTVIAWPAASNPTDPENWLECNGQAISQAAYPELFAVIGATVPDYQGMFLRGHGTQAHTQENGSAVGVTATIHSSGALGMVQGDAVRRMVAMNMFADNFGWRSYYIGGPFSWRYVPGMGGFASDYTGGYLDYDTALGTPTTNEIRPVNMAVRYLIRALE